MRLIDADALLEQYNLNDATKYGNKDAEQQAHSYSTMMMYEIADMIEDAPTAYDVDKVVAELEMKIDNAEFDEMLSKDEKDAYMDAYRRAIEIVKGGGEAESEEDCSCEIKTIRIGK